LLDRENKNSEDWWRSYAQTGTNPQIRGDGYGEYLFDLLNAVIGLDDKRAVPSLAGAAWAVPAGHVLVRFGEESIAPLLAQIKNSFNPEVRGQGLDVLVTILENAEISTTSKEIIHQGLIRGLSDKNDSVRGHAIVGLGKIGEKSDVPLLESIAASDPMELKTKDGSTKYPNREKAKKTVKSLQEKE
jgi:HEAT repeat protein